MTETRWLPPPEHHAIKNDDGGGSVLVRVLDWVIPVCLFALCAMIPLIALKPIFFP